MTLLFLPTTTNCFLFVCENATSAYYISSFLYVYKIAFFVARKGEHGDTFFRRE